MFYFFAGFWMITLLTVRVHQLLAAVVSLRGASSDGTNFVLVLVFVNGVEREEVVADSGLQSMLLEGSSVQLAFAFSAD